MISTIDHRADLLTVAFDDDVVRHYPTLWLRDNIPNGRHRHEGQRLFDINSLDADMVITDAIASGDGIQVTFSEGTTDLFPASFLRQHSLTGVHEGAAVPAPSLWGAERQRSLHFADYPTLLASDSVRLDWLRDVRDYGYGLIENMPAEPGAVLTAVDLFGFVRETNYGKLFEVIVQPDPANLANTSAHIGMHTDNPYRDPVPGLQLLHCIVNESDGGESQLVDGFSVAERLRVVDAEAFSILASHPVRFRYLDAGKADLQHYGPLIETDSRGNVTGIRYNSRSASAFDMSSNVLPEFYRAYRRLAEMLNDPSARIEFRLSPGQLMIFDNQRVLHGRSAYRVGHRHLQGCYADKDALHSAIRVLEHS